MSLRRPRIEAQVPNGVDLAIIAAGFDTAELLPATLAFAPSTFLIPTGSHYPATRRRVELRQVPEIVDPLQLLFGQGPIGGAGSNS